MLNSLRKNAQSWIIKTVLWLIVAAFIGTIFLVWGRGGDVAKSDIAVMVNEKAITLNQFYKELDNLENVYREVYGNLPDTNQLDKSKLKQEALNNLIDRELMLEAADKLRIEVSDGEVGAEIANNAAFNENGRFSKERYLQLLRTNNITPLAFEGQIKTELKLKKLSRLIQSTVRVSEKEIKDRFEVLERQIRVNYLVFDPAKTKVPAPSNKDIAAYYGNNKNSFRTPARARIEYGLFDETSFASKVTITDEELKTYYDANQDRYPAPESRRLYEISLPYKGTAGKKVARKKAEGLLQDISSGKINFKEAMKKNSSLSSQKTGKWYEKNELPKKISEKIFSLSVDGTAGPLDTGKSISLFKVVEIRRSEPLPFDKARKKIVSDLEKEKARDMAIIKAYEARSRLMKGEKFSDVLASYGIKTEKTGLISAASAPPPIKSLISASFLLTAGDTGEVKEINRSYYVYKLLEKRSPAVKDLNKVRSKIEKILLTEKKKEKTMELARKILDAAGKGKSLESAAKSTVAKFGSSGFFSPLSSTGIPGLTISPEFSQLELTLGRSNRHGEKPLLVGGKIYLIEYGGEKKSSMKNYTKEKEQIGNILISQKKEMALKSFISEERKKATITLGEELKI